MDQEKRAGTESGYRPTHDQSGSHAQIPHRSETDALRAELAKATSDSERLLSAVTGTATANAHDVVTTYQTLTSLALEFRGKAAQRGSTKLAQDDIRNCCEAVRAAKKLEPRVQATVRALVASICGQDSQALSLAMAA